MQVVMNKFFLLNPKKNWHISVLIFEKMQKSLKWFIIKCFESLKLTFNLITV